MAINLSNLNIFSYINTLTMFILNIENFSGLLRLYTRSSLKSDYHIQLSSTYETSQRESELIHA